MTPGILLDTETQLKDAASSRRLRSGQHQRREPVFMEDFEVQAYTLIDEKEGGRVHIMQWHDGSESANYENGEPYYPRLNELREKFKKVVASVRNKLGAPDYEGNGLAVRRTSDASGVLVPHIFDGVDLKTYFPAIAQSLEIACWERGTLVAAVMVTQHDGGCMISLDFEIEKKQVVGNAISLHDA